MTGEREAIVAATVRAHRRNEVIEPDLVQMLPGRTRVKCDSGECDFYGVYSTWYRACDAHEAHVAAAITQALAQGGDEQAARDRAAVEALRAAERETGKSEHDGTMQGAYSQGLRDAQIIVTEVLTHATASERSGE